MCALQIFIIIISSRSGILRLECDIVRLKYLCVFKLDAVCMWPSRAYSNIFGTTLVP